jgi:TM2 domain-containing membrane protein YozV
MAIGSENFLFYVMFWTILAMMLVLITALKMVFKSQRYIENIDRNIEKMVKRTLLDEERILDDIEDHHHKNKKKR